MKKFLRLATLLFAFAAIGFVSCEDPNEGFGSDGVGIIAKTLSTAPSSATLEVKTSGLSRIAWLAKRTDTAQGEVTTPMPVIIFQTGSQMEVTNGTHTVEVKNLEANGTYNIYLVGEVAATEDLTQDVVVVEGVVTTDFSEAFRVHSVHYRGFSIDVKVPESVKKEDHLIKWGASDLYLYNKNRYDAKGLMSDAQIINTNDKDSAYGQFFFNESTTLHLNEEDSYRRNPDGSIDKETYLYESLVPGQPEVVILGEFEFAESLVGWGWGYYEPLFDNGAWSSAVAMNGSAPVDETPYWDGLYINETVMVQAPEKLDDSMLDVTIERRTDDAMITVKADKSLEAVFIMILDDEQHAVAYRNLGETYDHFQWFATSLVGAMEGATAIYNPKDPKLNGVIRTALSEYLINVSQTSHYWVYIVGAKGDVDGDGYPDYHHQVCWHDDFDLLPRTKPAPELVVEALEPEKPNTALYRVFCPTGDATKGYYMSNYEKEWLSSGMTAQQLIDNYSVTDPYFAFTATDIDKINGLDGGNGLVLEFISRPNENYHFAAMIANDEGTRTYSDKVVCRTYEAPVEQVESEYFESLKGEWTGSATVRYKKLRDDIDLEDESLTDAEKYEEKVKTHTCTITVGDTEYPEVLPESVYETYEKLGIGDRNKVDGYYADLTSAIDLFNETNRQQNRILMNGFNFAGEMLANLPYFNYQSPYDLFTSTEYNGMSNEMPVYDFGPKWFIEVMADGSLGVPFNTEYFAPMGSWCFDSFLGLQEIYMIAYEPTTPMAVGYLTGSEGAVTGYFPVEVSEDGNTLTVKPFIYNDGSKEYKFYPNVGVYGGIDPETYGPAYSMSIAIISEITLTRGASSAAAAMAPARTEAPVVEQVESMNEIKTSRRPYKRSNFSESMKHEIVGPDHSLTSEQRGQQWLEMRRNLYK